MEKLPKKTSWRSIGNWIDIHITKGYEVMGNAIDDKIIEFNLL